jgi:hypothetical protein
LTSSEGAADEITGCRLFVYLARDAPIGVVLRRGPSDWARLSLWHTNTDRIEHGQWIKGRVYERRSDLSPDGRIFAAFVRQSGGRGESDTWVALSRPPYFTALAVWFIGGTYYTGALFPRERRLWLGFLDQPSPDVGSTPSWLTVATPRDLRYIDGTAEWTERTVHFNRLLRDGWQLLDQEPHATRWERRHPQQARTLTMLHTFDDFRTFGGPYVSEYAVLPDAAPEQPLGRASWADWDQRGRLVVARQGRLLSWGEREGFTEIEDFNDQVPDPQPAPDWATRWW